MEYAADRLSLQKLVLHTSIAVVNEDWMGSDPGFAFLTALGAGPWKFSRRKNVQTDACRWLAYSRVDDLSDMDPNRATLVYPLEWQNDFLCGMLKSLRKDGLKFNDMCLQWAVKEDWEASLKDIFKRCGSTEDGPKVLWMFARDHLKLPSFPIDRHVRRSLEEHDLPTTSFEMTRLCLRAGVDPNPIARSLFANMASNTE